MTETVTLERARELDLKKYHGKACRNCGCTEKYTASRTCCACHHKRFREWQNGHRPQIQQQKSAWRKRNPDKARKTDRLKYQRSLGLITKPTRGTGVLLVNLQPDQCKAVIKQPPPPDISASWHHVKEMDKFKRDLPKETICCGAPVTPGTPWCRYHGAAVADAEKKLAKV
jgi:hypothetical protein